MTMEVKAKAPNFHGHSVRLAKNSFMAPDFLR
jgi:hypothetical protein